MTRRHWFSIRLILLLAFTCWLTGCETLGHLKDERQGWTVYGPEGRQAIYSGEGRLIRVIENQKEK